MKTLVFGIMRDLNQEARDYQKRCDAIRAASKAMRRNLIAQICAHHELESDEFLTAEQKALYYL